MSKRKKYLDPRQAALDFDAPIEAYSRLRDELLSETKPPRCIESYEEGCIEIAAAAKRAIRKCGLSREEVVDAINKHFGWSGSDKRKVLSIHIFNHYLSKPDEYPLPAIILMAIQRITGSLEPVTTMAEVEGARVISGDEVRKLALGKLDDAIQEMRRLKREFREKGVKNGG